MTVDEPSKSSCLSAFRCLSCFSTTTPVETSLKDIKEQKQRTGGDNANGETYGGKFSGYTRQSIYLDALESLNDEREAKRITALIAGDDVSEEYFDTDMPSQSLYDKLMSRSQGEVGNYIPVPAITKIRRPQLDCSLESPQSMLKLPVENHKHISIHALLRKKPKKNFQAPGYPGALTEHELETCLEFRQKLKERAEAGEPAYEEIVYAMKSIEDDAFALCRFLRARQFNIDEVFKMIEAGVEVWKEGKKHEFYPDIAEAIGAPLSVFTSQYPEVSYGIAKNGCPVAYFRAGQVNVDGLECITTLDKFVRVAWHDQMFQFPQKVLKAREHHPDGVRCESVIVIDLKGLSRSTLSSRTMAVLKEISKINVCFPEILNCMAILNAPGFFSFAWRIIKTMIDARTASKISIISDEKKGEEWLKTHIPKKEILSDYGGKGPSFQSLMLETQQDNAGGSQVIKLMTIKNSSDKKGYEFDLSEGQCLESLNIYTRSVVGCNFAIFKNGLENLSSVDIKNTNQPNRDGEVAPFSVSVVKDVKGPGKIKVVAKLKGKASAQHFLIVGMISSSD